ncbi:MAG: hypothetical protein LBD89_04585 [Tannerellaceae bacterium]|jgi:hypothetical protein|nr:hypothetical protein [Tannerellaceae bacterium]
MSGRIRPKVQQITPLGSGGGSGMTGCVAIRSWLAIRLGARIILPFRTFDKRNKKEVYRRTFSLLAEWNYEEKEKKNPSK